MRCFYGDGLELLRLRFSALCWNEVVGCGGGVVVVTVNVEGVIPRRPTGRGAVDFPRVRVGGSVGLLLLNDNKHRRTLT